MIDQVGYCTNVHGGVTLDEVKKNLERFAVPVREQLGNGSPLPVGLWLSKSAAEKLATIEERQAFSDWLGLRQLKPYTINGFPFGDFHQAVVKHDVYLPTWADESRLQYTKQLADILMTLMGEEQQATISTLPLAWPTSSIDDSFFVQCARQLADLADYLAEIRSTSGKSIQVCIEPEPGCVLDTAADIVEFFERYLFASGDSEVIREHLGVCHDVCHSAVMFEPQELAVQRYLDAGIPIGKVQVSSAVEADFDSVEAEARVELVEELAAFAEQRYLHQTTISQESETTFFEDLSYALESKGASPAGKWRVHFHVPVFQSRLGKLGTTQEDIVSLRNALVQREVTPQWEIETYAWNVLPDELQDEPLENCIAREIRWFADCR